VHQFCRLGRYAYIGAATVITQDVPPFSLIVTERETRCFGPNTIGLERKGFSAERIKALQKAFRVLTRSKEKHFASARRDSKEHGEFRRREGSGGVCGKRLNAAS